VMAAATVLQHQAADVSRGGAIDDAVAARDHRVLLPDTPRRMEAHICLSVEGIEGEGVASSSTSRYLRRLLCTNS
jgi:hypothetical protein